MSDTTAAARVTDVPADRAAGMMQTFVGSEGGIRLSIGVSGSNSRLIVREARHEGAADALTTRVLDTLCQLVVGRPLQEAADHGAIYVTAALRNDCAPINGIRTPRNAGPAFALAERLVRQAHAAARQHFNVEHRENAWYVRPKAKWLSMAESAQVNAIKPIIARFLSANQLDTDDIFISRIERGTRVTVAFSEGVSYAVKPKLIMLLEQQLRHETGDPLELFMDEMTDANKIRRL